MTTNEIEDGMAEIRALLSRTTELINMEPIHFTTEGVLPVKSTYAFFHDVSIKLNELNQFLFQLKNIVK